MSDNSPGTAMPALRALMMVSLALSVAACGSSALDASSLLPKIPGTTASVTPSAPKPITATDRAVHVAQISAKAQKCGYNFDPAKLKAGFMAAETGRGTPADEVMRIEKAYDLIGRKVAASIADPSAYCSSGTTEGIKRDLTAVLAGQFDPPKAVDYDAVLAGYTKKPDEKFDYERAIGGSEVRERKKQSGSSSSED